jgi:hypothetical protein
MKLTNLFKQSKNLRRIGKRSRKNTKVTLTLPTGKKVETQMMGVPAGSVLMPKSVDEYLERLYKRYPKHQIEANPNLSMLREHLLNCQDRNGHTLADGHFLHLLLTYL